MSHANPLVAFATEEVLFRNYIYGGDMERRNFIYTSLHSVAAVAFMSVIGVARAGTAKSHRKLVVCFNTGTFEKIAEDGSWHICVLADPRRSQSPERIRLNFEVARDESFEDIITTERHFARKADSYILRVHYHPPAKYDHLYYRFVAVDAIRPAPTRRFAEPGLRANAVKRLDRQA